MRETIIERLSYVADRDFIRKIIRTGHEFDVESKDGFYDARGGCVNIWCRAEDKPECWNKAIQAGAFPADLVGTLSWDWDDKDKAHLYIEADPYALFNEYSDYFREFKHLRHELTLREARQILGWLRAKAIGLINLANLQPEYLGLKCPFCAWMLPAEQLLNRLVEHISAEHEPVQSVALGRPTVLRLASGNYPLESMAVEAFTR